MQNDEHIFLYTKNLEDIFPNMSGTGFRLLFLILSEARFPVDYNIYRTRGNVVLINKEFKQEWAEKLGITSGAVNSIMTILLKKELLLPKGRPIYILNPHYFFKGSAGQREKALKEIK